MLYVDDIILILGPRRKTIGRLICQVGKRFEVVDVDEASYLLGLATSRDAESGSIKLSQEAFAKCLLERFGTAESRPTTTPAEVGPISTREE